jgi:hypothetical protein
MRGLTYLLTLMVLMSFMVANALAQDFVITASGEEVAFVVFGACIPF